MTAAMAVAQSTAQFGRNGLPVLKVVGNDLGQDGRQEKAMSVGAVDADALAMDGDLGNVVIKCGTHSNRIFGNAGSEECGVDCAGRAHEFERGSHGASGNAVALDHGGAYHVDVAPPGYDVDREARMKEANRA